MRIINSFFHWYNSKNTSYINNPKEFQIAVHDIASQKFIGVDTEFTWRDTYLPKLSLIQISTTKNIYLFDYLALKNLEPLKDIFENTLIQKIFHSARGDISVLKTSQDWNIENIFDTQLAESILRNKIHDQLSYKKLVKKYFFNDLSKNETNSNWHVRPLSQSQIKYAAEDVNFLIELMNIQSKLLYKHKALDQFKELCSKEKDLGETEFCILRLNRYQKKHKNISALEKEIFIWRENEALNHNIPTNDICKEKNIKLISSLVTSKKINDCKWIIKKEAIWDDFVEKFG